MPFFRQSGGDMGPVDIAVGGLGPDGFVIYLIPRPVQGVDEIEITLGFPCQIVSAHRPDGGEVDGIDEQAQQMELPALIFRGKFHAGDRQNVPALRRRQKIRQAVHGVVVRQGNGGKAQGNRLVDEFRRGAGAVGEDGMGVQIAEVLHGNPSFLCIVL